MILADGTRYDGYLVGSACPDGGLWGEVVFNTSMTGYQEVITDPSYAGQIVVMTYPQIGNYGVTPDDSERDRVAARALVVRELSPVFSPGPNRISLEQFMREQGLVGLSGIDTRAVTRRIRSQGAVIAAVGRTSERDAELLELARSKRLDREQALVASVSGGLASVTGTSGRVAVVDLGIKQNILRSVEKLGVTTKVVDRTFKAADVLAGGFDFVVLSNGPGDPTDIPEVVEEVRALIGNIPILGICLGHQLIALALGASTYKLKFGHHGANQPVVDKRSGRVFITSQNHNYAVADDIAEKTGAAVTYVNASDGTLEGFADEARRIECVQFHPEAAPGPNDTAFVFEQFRNRVKEWGSHAANR
jgi:carbamoyl-phosphate synthase small subunit